MMIIIIIIIVVIIIIIINYTLNLLSEISYVISHKKKFALVAIRLGKSDQELFLPEIELEFF
jgi:hypothetical protein